MAAKPVQVSLDGDLLQRIDRDPEAKKLGRSAFIRNAVSTYLQAKERRDVDAALSSQIRDVERASGDLRSVVSTTALDAE